METVFDRIAEEYDSTFTDSYIGKAQRGVVWSYVDNFLKDKKELNILELNCGTGEDAIHFARMGHNVLATDQSIAMLEITRRKVESEKLNNKINIRQLDILQLSEQEFKQKFDLIFSDFGGLNCINRNNLVNLSETIKQNLTTSGRLIFVIMSNCCAWESLYYLLKLKFKESRRRKIKSGVQASLNGDQILTYYYSPKEVKNIFNKNFNIISTRPVGLFIPPSYLEKFFKGKTKMFNILRRLENIIHKSSSFSSFSDHFIADFSVK